MTSYCTAVFFIFFFLYTLAGVCAVPASCLRRSGGISVSKKNELSSNVDICDWAQGRRRPHTTSSATRGILSRGRNDIINRGGASSMVEGALDDS